MITVRDNPERCRYEVYVEGRRAGFASYRLSRTAFVLTHTEINRRFNGRGLARRLVTEVLEDVRERGLAVLPLCPYVRRVIAMFPEEYLDLVPMLERERFDLPATGDGEIRTGVLTGGSDTDK